MPTRGTSLHLQLAQSVLAQESVPPPLFTRFSWTFPNRAKVWMLKVLSNILKWWYYRQSPPTAKIMHILMGANKHQHIGSSEAISWRASSKLFRNAKAPRMIFWIITLILSTKQMSRPLQLQTILCVLKSGNFPFVPFESGISEVSGCIMSLWTRSVHHEPWFEFQSYVIV